MRTCFPPAREGYLGRQQCPKHQPAVGSTTQCSDVETQPSVDAALHGCSTAGEEPPTQGTGLPPRPRLRPADVPRLVYAALEQGIAAAQSPQSPADADAAMSTGSGAASAGGEPDIEPGGELGADELAGGADPGKDPAAVPAGSDEGSKGGAEASAETSAEALPVISEAIRTLQALGCARLSLTLDLSLSASRQRTHDMGSALGKASTAFARPYAGPWWK